MSQSDFMSLQPWIKHINNMVNSLISHKNVVVSKGSAGKDSVSQVVSSLLHSTMKPFHGMTPVEKFQINNLVSISYRSNPLMALSTAT